MPQVYSPINFELWPIFNHVPALFQERTLLVHIFGDGGNSVLFVTDDDSVYAVGSNDLGRLGIGDIDFTPIPVEVPFLKNKNVKCFATGSVHTLALTESGDLFSWGNNTLGRLGNGTIIDRVTPGRVLLQEGDQVEAVCCADRYSLALTKDHKVLHWGDIQFSSCTGQNIPCELRINCSGYICEIACGGFHAAAMTNEGMVYTWGVNSLGQLGRDTDAVDVIPTLVDRSLHIPAISIGCGLLTTIILNSNRKLESWGYFKGLDELDCPPIDGFMISNMEHIIGMKCGDDFFYYGSFNEINESEGVPLLSMDYSPKRINVKNMQNAFARRSTPQFLRANASDLIHDNSPVETMVGPARDICEALFDRKENSDLTIKLSDGVVYVHKLILTTFCEHFKSMILGSWAKETKNELDMQSYNAKAYRAFVKFVYSGKLEPLLGPELIDLYNIAESYFESDLKSMVVIMFRRRLKPENVANLYSLADKGRCEELIEICFEYASGYVDEVVLSDGFDKLSPELSKSLIKESTKKKKKNI